MLIRGASECDTEAIGLIRVRAWRAAYEAFMPVPFLAQLDPTANVAHWREKLSSQGREFSVNVAEHERTVVGFSVIGLPRYLAAPGAVELWSVNVDPSFWKRGVGSALVRGAIATARDYAYSRIELWCISGNMAARSLYAKCGFSETGRERTTSHLTGHPLHEVSYELVF
jgi:RimJ/RimL family protein N-acetyltransferase